MIRLRTVRIMLYQKVCLVLLTCVVVFSFVGCDPYADRYPYSSDSIWICEDPSIILNYTYDEQGTLIGEEVLENNGESILIRLDCQASSFQISRQDSYRADDVMVRGTWTYRKGKLVLYIKEDFFFDGKYTEFVFEHSN